MKKKILTLFFAALSLFVSVEAGVRTGGKTALAESEIEVRSKSAYLMDYDSRTEIFSCRAGERLPIASMCKIMTLILCFDAISEGKLSFEDEVPVSEHASSMGGSQVFLESGASYKAGELIKSIIVCSANDSCVAMAEYIAGSDGVFVARMNERAKSLGANDTVFVNCTGLPKETQYSTAHDVAYMLKELLSHDEYYTFSGIYTENFEHPKARVTEMTNTNKLIRTYSGCDGGKTGFTNQAGFCLAATAKRGDMRVVSVVIGADSSKSRFEDTTNLFDYAFANYTNKIVVDDENPLAEKIAVKGGKNDEISVCAGRKGTVFSPKGNKNEDIDIEFLPYKDIQAPVRKGDQVGEIVIFKDGVEYSRIPALAYEDDEKATFGDCVRRAASDWGL